jgi:hypothetical protein
MCLSVIFFVDASWRRPHIRDSRDGIGFEKRHGLQADSEHATSPTMGSGAAAEATGPLISSDTPPKP